jgi:Fic family protein
VLDSPVFYLSSYLKTHRQEYCARLLGITEQNDWESLLLFFLEAVRAQAEANARQVNDILDLYKYLQGMWPRITRSLFSNKVLQSLFTAPIFRQSDFIKKVEIPQTSSKRIVSILLENNILKKTGS